MIETDVTVLGTGAAATALAGRAAGRGHRVRMWGRPGERLTRIAKTGELTVREPCRGPVRSRCVYVGDDLARAVSAAEVVVVAVSSTALAEVVERCSGSLRDDQFVFLVPGHSGGLWTAQDAIARAGTAQPTVGETFLPFVCRSGEPGEATILQDKREVPLSVAPPARQEHALEHARGLGWPVTEIRTPLEMVFQNMTVVFQPALMVCNSARVEAGEHFRIYDEGATPGVARLLAALDRERLGVAEAYGVRGPTAAEWLRQSYGAEGDDLGELLRSVPGYRGIGAPASLDHRFLREHVQAGLVPVGRMARAAGVPTPMIDAVVELASALLGEDLRAGGRDLSAFTTPID